MGLLGTSFLDFAVLWTWILVFARLSGIMTTVPGIGTVQVSPEYRLVFSLLISSVVVATGVRSPEPSHLMIGVFAISSEYLLGYLIGSMPQMLMAGLSLGGQTNANAIGLAQANSIDPSLGESASVLSHIATLIGTTVFLAMNGHHAVIYAAFAEVGNVGYGNFHFNSDVAMLFVNRIHQAFILGVMVAAPIIATTLISQFVLGIVTKFVPQMNIFIVSAPLSILAGLFIIAYTVPTMVEIMLSEFIPMQDAIQALLTRPE